MDSGKNLILEKEILGKNVFQESEKKFLEDENKENLETNELTSKSDDEKNVEEEMADLPPLEDFSYDEKSEEKKKTIRIEDKKEEKISDDGWLDILDNGDIRKRIITEGDNQLARPERGCIAFIKLTTRLSDTQVIVNSETFERIDVVVGDGDVIQGIDLALPLMFPGEEAQVVVKARFAYGSLGKGDEVPPDATLDCHLHLLAVQWNDDDDEPINLPLNERIRIGNRKKERGNFWYGRGEYSNAIQSYRSALNFLDANESEMAISGDKNESEVSTSGDTQQNVTENTSSSTSNGCIPNIKTKGQVDELIELRSTTFNNLAAAQLKIEAFDAALKSVDSVLLLQPDNVKALFRKGKILGSMGELVQSIETLQKAVKLEPDSKIISQELNKMLSKKKKELVSERDMYKRMLELDKKEETNEGKKIKSKSWLKWGMIGGFVAAAASAVVYKVLQ